MLDNSPMKNLYILTKMRTHLGTPINYSLMEQSTVRFDLNSYLGKTIELNFTGRIQCSNCGKVTKKSYSQGHCYPCMMKLASCDLCILRPETCHYDKGTCREPDWAAENCFRPHIIYLANSSGLKVGITRKTQIPTRWIDQGASEALAIIEVKDRLTSGQIEVLFKKHIADKTDWRKMLRGEPEPIDLIEWKDKLLNDLKLELEKFEFDILDEVPVKLDYPILSYPEKVSSINLEKRPQVRGKLIGIKGQYLILDSGVLNIRSHSGYEVSLEEISE